MAHLSPTTPVHPLTRHPSCIIYLAPVIWWIWPKLWGGLEKIITTPLPLVGDKYLGSRSEQYEREWPQWQNVWHNTWAMRVRGGTRWSRPVHPGKAAVVGKDQGARVTGQARGAGGNVYAQNMWLHGFRTKPHGKDHWNESWSLLNFSRPNPISRPSQSCGYMLISLTALSKVLNVIWVP